MNWRGSAGDFLDWAAAGRPIAGQVLSGDLHLVAPFPGGVLVAVVDGLGHGRHAEESARAALDVLRLDPGLSPDALVARCHETMNRLRGAVMSLASFDAARSTMTWTGVGNVEGVLLRARPRAGQSPRERLLLWGGIVGQTLPRLRSATLPVFSGDVLVLVTDGLRASAFDDVRTADTVEAIATGVLASHARSTDDALVLVARCGGSAS
jgi:negative regulator of sigma-B (phosphoserine phosphatase)